MQLAQPRTRCQRRVQPGHRLPELSRTPGAATVMRLKHELRAASLDGIEAATRDFLVANHAMEIAKGTEVRTASNLE